MELLKKLVSCPAPSGREEKIRELIKDEVKEYADEIYTDPIGNLIVHKKGKGKKIMVAAHMDEIGIISSLSDDDGFIRFSGVGGLNTKDLIGRRVMFENGIYGVIGSDKDNKDRNISKMYIDIGAKDKTDADNKVGCGCMGIFCGEFTENDGLIISKALDNRTGCYIMIDVIKKIKSDNDIFFVFSVQEEVGLRGAKTSAFSIAPDYSLSIDVTDTGDTPEKLPIETKLGGGACIKVMDRSVLCHPEVRSILTAIAKEKEISYQLEIMTDGGTDAGAMSLAGHGSKTGGISVPVRYIHSPSEMASKKDICDCASLLYEFLMYRF